MRLQTSSGNTFAFNAHPHYIRHESNAPLMLTHSQSSRSGNGKAPANAAGVPIPPQAALEREPRSPSAERWLVAGWVLIALKCTLIWWAITAYAVPIDPLWLVVPTVAFALLATGLYLWRD